MRTLQFAKNFLDSALQNHEFEFQPRYLRQEDGTEERELTILYEGYSFSFLIEYTIHNHTTHLSDPNCSMDHVDIHVADIYYQTAFDNEGEEINLHQESVDYLIQELWNYDLS